MAKHEKTFLFFVFHELHLYPSFNFLQYWNFWLTWMYFLIIAVVWPPSLSKLTEMPSLGHHFPRRMPSLGWLLSSITWIFIIWILFVRINILWDSSTLSTHIYILIVPHYVQVSRKWSWIGNLVYVVFAKGFDAAKSHAKRDWAVSWDNDESIHFSYQAFSFCQVFLRAWCTSSYFRFYNMVDSGEVRNQNSDWSVLERYCLGILHYVSSDQDYDGHTEGKNGLFISPSFRSIILIFKCPFRHLDHLSEKCLYFMVMFPNMLK